MTTVDLKLHPAAVKFLDYYHERLPGVQPELTNLFRRLVIMMAEPMWDNETKSYKQAEQSPDLTASIKVRICSQSGNYGIDNRGAVWIPPHKMKMMSDFLIELFEKEINDTVDIAITNGKEINLAIQSVFDKYDIDESIEYKMDTALRMNLRYRKKIGSIG